VSAGNIVASVEAVRRPRNELPPEGVYHVTTRGVARTAIFLDDDERRLFLRLFAAEVERHDWRCHAFCLLTTHYHLVVETQLWRLSDGMHRLNGTYALSFNRRHRRSGHLFGERFAAWVPRDDAHLETTCEYVRQNPVRAGLCSEARDWPWAAVKPALKRTLVRVH
jgi:REP element-mobilizing transposase RayT